MRRILYIGIAGKKGHGKDAFANLVKTNLQQMGITTVKRGFADALREEAVTFLVQALQGSPHFSNNPSFRLEEIARRLRSNVPEYKEPFRLLMQWWGTEYRRNMFDETYWIRALESHVETVARDLEKEAPTSLPLVVLVPDVRLPNEVNFIRGEDGVLVKVQRPSLAADGDTHITETALDSYNDWDSFILNDSTLSALEYTAMIFIDNRLKPILKG